MMTILPHELYYAISLRRLLFHVIKPQKLQKHNLIQFLYAVKAAALKQQYQNLITDASV